MLTYYKSEAFEQNVEVNYTTKIKKRSVGYKLEIDYKPGKR